MRPPGSRLRRSSDSGGGGGGGGGRRRLRRDPRAAPAASRATGAGGARSAGAARVRDRLRRRCAHPCVQVEALVVDSNLVLVRSSLVVLVGGIDVTGTRERR